MRNGNLRGTPPTWSSSNGFLNKPASTFSGLTYVGARAYDPGLGKFLSVDAVLSPFHPQQNNGYAYSNNNPVTLSDPSGNRPSENPDSSYHPGDYLPGGGGSSSAPPAAGNSGGGMSRSKGSGPEYVSVSPHVLITKDGGLVPGMRSAYAATRNSFGFTPNSTLSETQEMALWFQTCLVNSPGTCDPGFANAIRHMGLMSDDYGLQLESLAAAGTAFFFLGSGSSNSSVMRSFSDPESMAGVTLEQVREMVPEGWIESPLNKGNGVKWLNPEGGGKGFIEYSIDGIPNSSEPIHSGGSYLKVMAGGEQYRAAAYGNAVLSDPAQSNTLITSRGSTGNVDLTGVYEFPGFGGGRGGAGGE